MSYLKINKIDAIDSTNLALKRKYHKGLTKHGEVLWALDQVKGKDKEIVNGSLNQTKTSLSPFF